VLVPSLITIRRAFFNFARASLSALDIGFNCALVSPSRHS
jgi:hypothetical protein